MMVKKKKEKKEQINSLGYCTNMAVQYGRLLITCKPAVHVNKKAGVCE